MSYDPEHYIESTVREVKGYVESNLNTRIYSVVMEFPGSVLDAQKMPPRKTIIHFEIDDIRDEHLGGFGSEPVDLVYSSDGSMVQGRWAGVHFINFDVGIWASDDSGGITARMRAKQLLTRMFGYPNSIQNMRKFSDGGDGSVEIVRWTGGTNVEDRVNDIRVYRSMAMELEVRVFSRTSQDDSEPVTAIQDIIQQPHLTILG